MIRDDNLFNVHLKTVTEHVCQFCLAHGTEIKLVKYDNQKKKKWKTDDDSA